MLVLSVLLIRAAFWSYDTDFDGWVRQNPLSMLLSQLVRRVPNRANTSPMIGCYFKGGSYQGEVIVRTSLSVTPSGASCSTFHGLAFSSGMVSWSRLTPTRIADLFDLALCFIKGIKRAWLWLIGIQCGSCRYGTDKDTTNHFNLNPAVGKPGCPVAGTQQPKTLAINPTLFYVAILTCLWLARNEGVDRYSGPSIISNSEVVVILAFIPCWPGYVKPKPRPSLSPKPYINPMSVQFSLSFQWILDYYPHLEALSPVYPNRMLIYLKLYVLRSTYIYMYIYIRSP